MTRRPTETMRRPGAAAALAAVALGAAPASAQLVTRFDGNASVREGVATNPFLDAQGGAAAGYIEFSAAPSLTISEPLATTSLSGQYRRTQYYERYGSTNGYSLSAAHSRQLSGHTSASVSLQYDSSVIGQRDTGFFIPGVVGGADGGAGAGGPAGAPGTPDIPSVIDPIDPTLIGTKTKSRSLALSSNISTSLNAFDAFTLGANVSRIYYGSRVGADSRSYGTNFSYDRTLDEGSRAGVRLSLSRSDYLSNAISDSTIVQPQLTYSRQLGSRINVNVAIGGLFVQSDDGRQNTKSISGDIDGCWNGERDSLCFSASRDASASGAGGVRTRIGGAMHYSYRLAQYDTLRVDVDYSHYGAYVNGRPGSTLVDTTGSWDTRLSQRIVGGASASLRGSKDEFSTRRDFSLQVFLRVTLGQLL